MEFEEPIGVQRHSENQIFVNRYVVKQIKVEGPPERQISVERHFENQTVFKRPSKKQIGVQGRIISSQTREVIANVIKFMMKEAEIDLPVVPFKNYRQRILQATGISTNVYSQICKEMKLIENGEITSFTNPTKRKINIKKSVNNDERVRSQRDSDLRKIKEKKIKNNTKISEENVVFLDDTNICEVVIVEPGDNIVEKLTGH